MTDSLDRLVADLLLQLRSEPQDTIWSSYDSGEALIQDVEGLAALLDEDGDAAARKLRLLFAPTGALQETALSTGWAEEYMHLASRCDALLG